jgi:hypothetical protein
MGVEVTTKYSTGRSDTDVSGPAEFTENTDRLRKEFLGITRDEHTDTALAHTREEPDTPSENDPATPKYAELIKPGQIQAITEPTEEPVHNAEPEEYVVKGTYHSENRFFQRGDLSSEDAPESLHEAWKQGVRVGVQHHDTENYYVYKRARYNEAADIVMLMDDTGTIRTVLTVFEETLSITTGHLCRCGDPACGRLYSTQENGPGCHWCGYTKQEGRLKREVELLPKKCSSNATGSETTRSPNDEPEDVGGENHSLDTECEECGEVFNTVTRLRLHDC